MSVETISIFGCGWLGFPLGQELSSKGFTIKGSTTTRDKFDDLSAARIEPFFIECTPDLTGDSDQRIADFFQCDVLVITLPFRRGLEDPWEYYLQVRSIIEAAEECHVKRIVFTSSTSVYPNTNGIVYESDEFIPQADRAKALLATEQSVLVMEGLSTVVLRLAGLYGNDRQIGKFLSGKINIPNPEAPVNLVHQDDVIRIISLMLINQLEGVFNICSDAHPSRRELYVKAARFLGIPEPEFDEESVLSYKIVSNSKIKQALEYQFLHPEPLV